MIALADLWKQSSEPQTVVKLKQKVLRYRLPSMPIKERRNVTLSILWHNLICHLTPSKSGEHHSLALSI